MSNLKDLIKELCPEGVQHKPLGEVGVFTRGSGLQKKDFVDDGVGCIHYGQVYTHYGLSARRTFSFVTPEFAKNKRKVRPGDVFIATTSENDEDLGKAVAWLGDEEIVASGDGYIFHHELLAEYVSYFLNSTSFQHQKKRWITGTKVRRISGAALESIIIPVPPLPVQQEIVRILDKFTQLEAELEAELEARVRQYDHYRTSQFLRVEDAKNCSLGDVAEFKYGLTAKARDVGTHRFLRITDIGPRGKLLHEDPKFVEDEVVSEEYQVSTGDVFMARTGATYGKTMLAESDSPAVFASFLIRIRFDSSLINPSYYWHFAQSTLFWSQANSMVSQGSQPQFNANALKRVKFPVPSISEQNRIVQILDRFDALVNDVTIGLPAEIAARRKQFEYYRDKLLTFKELSA